MFLEAGPLEGGFASIFGMTSQKQWALNGGRIDIKSTNVAMVFCIGTFVGFRCPKIWVKHVCSSSTTDGWALRILNIQEGKCKCFCSKIPLLIGYYKTGWWFGTWFIFHILWDNPSHWLIFFRGVKTTHQKSLYYLTCCWLRYPISRGDLLANQYPMIFHGSNNSETRFMVS